MTVVEKSNFGGEGVTYFLKMRSGLAMSTMICLELKGFHCYSNANFFCFNIPELYMMDKELNVQTLLLRILHSWPLKDRYCSVATSFGRAVGVKLLADLGRDLVDKYSLCWLSHQELLNAELESGDKWNVLDHSGQKIFVKKLTLTLSTSRVSVYFEEP